MITNTQRPRATATRQHPVVKVAAVLRPLIAASAQRRSVTFADECQRLLAETFDLGGSGKAPVRGMRGGRWLKRWRQPGSPVVHGGVICLPNYLAPHVIEAAEGNGWPVADEVNSRLETRLAADPELNNGEILSDQPPAA